MSPSDTIVAEGSPALFNCTFTTPPNPVSVNWQSNGQVLAPSSKYSYLPNNSLLINPTEAGDDGTYSCVVTDQVTTETSSQSATLMFAGECSVMGHAFLGATIITEPSNGWTNSGQPWFHCLCGYVLNITELERLPSVKLHSFSPHSFSPPQVIQSSFLSEPQSTTVDEGANVNFFCYQAGSLPPAEITWRLNGNVIVTTSRTRIQTNILSHANPPQVSSTLVILAVQRSDEGQITCTATNPLLPTSSVVSREATLTIRGTQHIHSHHTTKIIIMQH